ncbi:FAD-dependent oxidoreductase [Ulvibacterium sp.]|uniref:FAD-dependent oxidoreductase n=1 Tax=Ulvibacterium sp. TaxID=2665914 RepID=UPI003BA9B34D
MGTSNNRRSFLKKSIIAATATPFLGMVPLKGADTPMDIPNAFKEPARQIPVVRETDVIVCGGGPAGIAAAIQSARQGANTTLIEMYGCLGGVWTTGLLSNIIDYNNKPGIMKELVYRLEQHDAQYTAKVYDAELMKYVLDQMCQEAGVEVRLHTRVVAAYRNKKNGLDHILTESFSGREAWKAKVFIDTTGNGDLAAKAGCSFDIGHPETGKTQPASLMAILVGLKEEELVMEGYMASKGKTTEHSKKKLYREIGRAGVTGSYTMPTMFGIRPGMIALMANHQYGMSALKADEITKATMEARKELHQIINGLRSLGGVWSKLRIATTGAQIGIREGRRIRGLYTLTANDLIKGAKFNDAVCRVTFPVDVHSLEKRSGGGYGNSSVKAKPYDVPLRSLIAKDVDGLLMAGRCISGDFFAHASYRVTGNAVPMGEAAGKVAAIASMENKLPQEVKYRI